MSSPYVGEIRMFGGNFAPTGWALCQGQTLPISGNDTLFNLIGTTFGGDGQQTFGLPNLQGRVMVHQGQGLGLSAYTLGESLGVEEVTLTTQQIPQHTHAVGCNSAGADGGDPSGKVFGDWGSAEYSDQPSNVTMNGGTVSSIGGNQPHENLKPYLAINFIISLFGIYPSQN